MLEAWRDEYATWSFWARWWGGAKNGTPLDWDLQTEVARIEDEEWEQGPEHIAGVIAGIEAEFLAERTKLGETLFLNDETGKLRLEGGGADNIDRLQSCVLKLKEIDALVEQFDNYKGMLRAEMFLIQRAIEHHPDNPVILHHNAKAAREILAGNVANGNCPSFEQEPVLELIDTTLLDVQMTLSNEPSVVEANGARASMSQVIASEDIRQSVLPAMQDLADVTEGRLSVEGIENAEIVADPNNPEALRKRAAEDIASRSIRIWILAKYAKARGGLQETSGFIKDLGIVTGGVGTTGAAGLGIWDKIYGSTHLADLIQKLIALM